MKLLINNKYEEVGFWSFMKVQFLTSLVLTGLVYLGLLLIGIAAGVLFI
jgi:hypothetical protein